MVKIKAAAPGRLACSISHVLKTVDPTLSVMLLDDIDPPINATHSTPPVRNAGSLMKSQVETD